MSDRVSVSTVLNNIDDAASALEEAFLVKHPKHKWLIVSVPGQIGQRRLTPILYSRPDIPYVTDDNLVVDEFVVNFNGLTGLDGTCIRSWNNKPVGDVSSTMPVDDLVDAIYAIFPSAHALFALSAFLEAFAAFRCIDVPLSVDWDKFKVCLCLTVYKNNLLIVDRVIVHVQHDVQHATYTLSFGLHNADTNEFVPVYDDQCNKRPTTVKATIMSDPADIIKILNHLIDLT